MQGAFKMAEVMGYQWSSWRKYPRVIPEKDRPVVAEVDDAITPAVVDVRDISEGGIDLELAEDMPEQCIDQELPLSVSLPAPINKTIRARGRVRHIEGRRVGVRFAELKPTDVDSLREYVQYLSKNESWLTKLRRRWWGNF
ncbi:hypothetical protein CAL65_14495 [Alkalilimnicola ehrlichii]|uniref:PilZ domain-containing protein n=2 Tax=Alkalilimnicola ehrlichii TaxID=351052 RepID=A0A3E0WPZ5_9GAMM|nr:hypothetical protein CAL65_14495 [Alkalilimnicola ehrlichii]